MNPTPLAPLASTAAVALRLFLEEAAAAMDATLRQAAGSASIGRHGSTAAGFYLPTGALLLGGRESHPLLLEAAAESLACLTGRHGTTGRPFASGDLYLTNDAGSGGAGVEDLVLATPILREGRLAAFVALTASHPGLGRATLAPVDHMRREGLILPWMRAGHLGRVQGDAVMLLAVNADDPTEFREEFAVQVHALGLGRGGLEEALEGFGRKASPRWRRWPFRAPSALCGRFWEGLRFQISWGAPRPSPPRSAEKDSQSRSASKAMRRPRTPVSPPHSLGPASAPRCERS